MYRGGICNKYIRYNERTGKGVQYIAANIYRSKNSSTRELNEKSFPSAFGKIKKRDCFSSFVYIRCTLFEVVSFQREFRPNADQDDHESGRGCSGRGRGERSW